jgi:hypothetical protein
MMDRREHRLLATGVVLVVCIVAVAIGLLWVRKNAVTTPSALSEASTSSERASAGARLAGGTTSGDREVPAHEEPRH